MSEENIKNIIKSNNLFAPIFVDHHVLRAVSFNWDYLIDNNISIPKKVINICISYILNQWPRDLNTD